jgi:hypothetical protein
MSKPSTSEGFFAVAVLFAALWIGTAIRQGFVVRDRDAARAEVADLQKQIADQKALPRFQGDAVRFIAISHPHRQTIVAVDATIVLRASDVPDLAQKVLDWLVAHPSAIRSRGLHELKAKIE